MVLTFPGGPYIYGKGSTWQFNGGKKEEKNQASLDAKNFNTS